MERSWVTIEGNEAVANVAHAMSEVIAIYPITPSTPMGNWPTPGPPQDESIYGERYRW